ncbi:MULTISPECIES: MetQ/NlpA family ABC transporter substrate-binding protein [unclassified Butyrivibrio]|uniref:MetQ/NlpA family ABC transporter substrate-binding protein n=1 Tax=unclassified Butyrivibrio TaxID=2639466 RepID=UPI0003B41F70|nr:MULTISPECIES: MetQ/NlpA family ABC transporter substrate-binding protein [unclassified Butyrivibrio]SDB28115.1 D-methionine transport system substrate-binding protein [Butyrivibrio sp. INlla16]SEL04442.1 D-methionine transport system substrate-binding protein [Butyrivibrio sp. ob235]
MKKLTVVKKITATAVLAGLLAGSLTGCGTNAKASAAQSDKKEITYAKGVGPYTELFEEAIIPILEKKGYTFKVSELDLNQADAAITAGDVDVSVEQHSAFLKAYNEQSGGNLVALSKIPTVPASVFSEKHASVDEIGEGQVIAIPQDAGNQARAFVMLQDLGWITLKEGTDFATASAEDVEENKYNLEFYELQTTYIATSLSDFDFGVITGSIVYNAGIDPSTALFNENLSEDFWLQVVVNADNADAQWAKDIVDAYQSEEFLTWIGENNGPKYNELWSIPSYN